MSTVEFTCTSCGKKMKTSAANAGKKGKCPQCGAVLDIPKLADDALMPPTSPPVKPTRASPPAGESPMKPPPRPKGDDELFGASSGSTASWDANQDFLGELAGPAAGQSPATPQGGGPQSGESPPQDLFGGIQEPSAYGSPAGYTPQPGYAPQPSYTPAPAVNPYAAPSPVYGGYASPAHGQKSDGMGIASMVLGIVGLVGMLLCFCLMCAYIGIFGLPLPLIIAVVGVILGHQAKIGGMRTAGLIMNYITLGIIGGMIVLFIVLMILGVGMAALNPK